MNPEDWTDEQWIAWLEATEEPAGGDRTPAPVTRMGRLTGSAGGTAIGNAMLGMANAIYGRRDDEVVVVAEAPGGPGPDDGFDVELDPEHPERSRVVHRNPPPS